jgi:probable rRNA maturation factor
LIILRKAVPGVTETALARFVAKATRAAGLRGTVNVLVTSNRELQNLNRRFRNKSYPTDVLSFPPLSDLPVVFAGDIAISAEIAAQNAKRLGHSRGEEVKVLILHGVLHLAGFDHERDNGNMARVEARLRRELKLPTALIERSDTGVRNRVQPSVNGRAKTSRTGAHDSAALRQKPATGQQKSANVFQKSNAPRRRPTR